MKQSSAVHAFVTAGVHFTRTSFLQTMKPVPEVIKLFFMLNSTEPDISTAHKNLNAKK